MVYFNVVGSDSAEVAGHVAQNQKQCKMHKIKTAVKRQKRKVTMSNKNTTAKTTNSNANSEKTLAMQIAEFNNAMLPADIVFNAVEFERMVKITKNGERQNTGKLTTAFLLANSADVLVNYTLQDLILYYAVAYKITITGDSKGNSISQKLRDQAAAMKISFKNSHAGTGKAARVEMEHRAELSAMETAHTAKLDELQAQASSTAVNAVLAMLNAGADISPLTAVYGADVIRQAQTEYRAKVNTELLQILNENNITTADKLRELIATANKANNAK